MHRGRGRGGNIQSRKQTTNQNNNTTNSPRRGGFRPSWTKHTDRADRYDPKPVPKSPKRAMSLYDFEEFLGNFVATVQSFDLVVSELKSQLMDVLIPLSIKFNIETTEDGLYLTLTTDRHGADFSIGLVRSSNGLVFKITKDLQLHLLVVPSNEFNNSFAAIDVEQHLKDDLYVVTKLEDGTTFNMYWDPTYQSWLYATKHSRNCGDIEWRGYKYSTIIHDCMAMYPEFTVDKLDKNCVYSFGFHHPSFHPFMNLGKTMWLIQIYNRVDHKTEDTDIGIPRQQTVNLSEIRLPESKSIYGDLGIVCNNALQQYLAKGEAHLGWILRSKDPSRTGAVSDLLIESNLFQTIKKCIYDPPYIRNKEVRSHVKSRFKNFNYVIVNAWLDFTKEPYFFALFPQFTDLRTRFNSVVEKALDQMIPLLSQGAVELEPTISVFRQTTDDEAASCLVANLLPIVKDKISAIDRQVIRNLILNPKFTETYVDVLF